VPTNQKHRVQAERKADGWRWLTLEEAAEYCGVKARTMRTWVETGRVTHYKPSRRLLFLRDDLDAAIADSRTDAEGR